MLFIRVFFEINKQIYHMSKYGSLKGVLEQNIRINHMNVVTKPLRSIALYYSYFYRNML